MKKKFIFFIFLNILIIKKNNPKICLYKKYFPININKKKLIYSLIIIGIVSTIILIRKLKKNKILESNINLKNNFHNNINKYCEIKEPFSAIKENNINANALQETIISNDNDLKNNTSAIEENNINANTPQETIISNDNELKNNISGIEENNINPNAPQETIISNDNDLKNNTSAIEENNINANTPQETIISNDNDLKNNTEEINKNKKNVFRDLAKERISCDLANNKPSLIEKVTAEFKEQFHDLLKKIFTDDQ